MRMIFEQKAAYGGSFGEPEVLTHPDFQDGFRAGRESYEADCEVAGRTLTREETCELIAHDISSQVREQSDLYDRHFGIAPRPLHEAGFLAGWLYAHLARS